MLAQGSLTVYLVYKKVITKIHFKFTLLKTVHTCSFNRLLFKHTINNCHKPSNCKKKKGNDNFLVVEISAKRFFHTLLGTVTVSQTSIRGRCLCEKHNPILMHIKLYNIIYTIKLKVRLYQSIQNQTLNILNIPVIFHHFYNFSKTKINTCNIQI